VTPVLKDISLGQYFPGRSLLHRLDPRGKLLLLVVYITALFVGNSAFQYLFMALWLTVAVASCRVKVKVLMRGMKPLLILIIFTAILNVVTTPGRDLLPGFFLRVTEEGIILAVKMISRIFMLISASFLLTYTTSPIQLTDALEHVMKPLKWIRVPVHELSMMMTIALRFIPTLIEETDKIMSAQRARGGDFDSGNIVRRVRALLPLLIPLILSAFRRAGELATAMECRCYQGDVGRTRLRVLRWQWIDAAVILLCLAMLAFVIIMPLFMPPFRAFVWDVLGWLGVSRL